MKWAGAILFISMTTWIGLEISKRFDNRPKHIRQLKNALQILEAEILYSQLPLQEAFFNIANQIPKPLNGFFNKLSEGLKQDDVDLRELWNTQVKTLMEHSSLGSIEREILVQFGQTLGQHDFTQQQKQIQLTERHLERELAEAQDEQYKYSKMVKSLGVLFGLFIVLLFL